MIQKCLDNQRPVIEKLNAKVNVAMKRSGQTKSPIFSKLIEVNDTFKNVHSLAQQRRNELLDKLQQVSSVKLISSLNFFMNNDCPIFGVI